MSPSDVPTVVIVNPAAGKGRGRAEFSRIRDFLGEHHPQAEIFLTEGPGHAARLLQGLPLPPGTMVIAVGGDGTVHEVGTALFEREGVRLGVVPLGSGNDIAAQLYCPEDPLECLSRLFEGEVIPWDMGTIGPHPFLNSVGFALSAETCYWSHRTGRLVGFARYGLAAARAWWTHDPLHVRVDGMRGAGECVVTLIEIGVGDRSGGGFRLTANAVVDDGLLDVCLVKALPRWQIPFLVPKALRGRHLDHPSVVYEQLASFRMGFDADQRIHVDGEVRDLPRGEHSVRVRPRALHLVSCRPAAQTPEAES